MRITWEINDGASGARKQFVTEIEDYFLDECSTDEEREELIEELVDVDFRERVGWREVKREEGGEE